MQLAFDFSVPFRPAPPPPAASIRSRRDSARAATRHYCGLAAEDAALRAYERRGASCLKRRYRCAYGELDLVLLLDGVLVFVEVKHRKHGCGGDAPVSPAQWRRIEDAAQHFMSQHQAATGTLHCRFDVAVVRGSGNVEIYESAHLCEG